MASNESALGPSAAVRDAIAGAAGRAARYPDPLATPLRIAEIFHAAGFETVPSAANFVLVLVPDEHEHGLVASLAAHGVSVRPGSSLGVPGTVRVSVPSPDGLARLERAVSAITGGSTSIVKGNDRS
jgi:histidinol-phosphate/aromatic aminotransferase/cobyric acid decarboxylase-like protein